MLVQRRRRDGDTDLAVEFGQRVRDLRKQSGLSQEAFAVQADVHRTFIGLIENGKTVPTLATIVRFANALNVDPAILIAGMGATR